MGKVKYQVSPERRQEIEERIAELGRILKVISQLQEKAISEGLTIEERSLALKYETQLDKWVNQEYPMDWLIIDSQSYAMAEEMHKTARALRKGLVFG